MNYAGSVASVTGSATSKGTSITTITSELPDPSVLNQPVVITVTVTGAGATPTGTVTVTSIGLGAPTCSFSTGATDHCNLTFITTTGSATITATFGGDANYNGSSSVTVNHIVH
jgi:hypothetical protein